MRFGLFSLSIPLAVAVLCGSSAAQVSPPAPSTEGYEVIAAKSIFLKNRTVVPIDKKEEDEPPPVRIEEQFILRGVVFQEDAFQAHIERIEGGGAIRLTVGDTVADGVVVEIGMNGIRYLKSGSDNPTWVGPGRNLAGTVSKIRETRR